MGPLGSDQGELVVEKGMGRLRKRAAAISDTVTHNQGDGAVQHPLTPHPHETPIRRRRNPAPASSSAHHAASRRYPPLSGCSQPLPAVSYGGAAAAAASSSATSRGQGREAAAESEGSSAAAAAAWGKARRAELGLWREHRTGTGCTVGESEGVGAKAWRGKGCTVLRAAVPVALGSCCLQNGKMHKIAITTIYDPVCPTKTCCTSCPIAAPP